LASDKSERYVWPPDIQGIRCLGTSLPGRITVDEVAIRIVFENVARGVEPVTLFDVLVRYTLETSVGALPVVEDLTSQNMTTNTPTINPVFALKKVMSE
jgi:hypothetical protein